MKSLQHGRTLYDRYDLVALVSGIVVYPTSKRENKSKRKASSLHSIATTVNTVCLLLHVTLGLAVDSSIHYCGICGNYIIIWTHEGMNASIRNAR